MAEENVEKRRYEDTALLDASVNKERGSITTFNLIYIYIICSSRAAVASWISVCYEGLSRVMVSQDPWGDIAIRNSFFQRDLIAEGMLYSTSTYSPLAKN